MMRVFFSFFLDLGIRMGRERKVQCTYLGWGILNQQIAFLANFGNVQTNNSNFLSPLKRERVVIR